MELASKIVRGHVFHKRLIPKVHQFKYPHLTFLLDIDELDKLSSSLKLFSHNGFGFYDFRDQDHLESGSLGIRQKVRELLVLEGINTQAASIKILASPRVLGYVFNPLSVYYCFDSSKTPFAVILEICNTFMERKAYVIDLKEMPTHGTIHHTVVKNFYISPYCKVDDQLVFELEIPEKKVSVRATTIRGEDVVIYSTLTGSLGELSDWHLIKCIFSYPLSTVYVIGRIHYHALLLFLKRVPFFSKQEKVDRQTGVMRPHSSLKEPILTSANQTDTDLG